jgi:hypothetical protein
MEEPAQGFNPTSKDQQRDPKSAPRIRDQGTDLRELGGVVLVDMVETLKSW